jgi:hypothetical protein
MVTEIAGLQVRSKQVGGIFELIDSAELAKRWKVPESWIRNHTRERTPKDARIPCVRFGRYVRFEYESLQLEDWLARHRR